MPHDVAIHPATRDHVAELMAICAEHAAFERLPHVPDSRADVLADALHGSPPRLYAWLASIDGAIVGYASATLDFSTLDRAAYLHMDCLYVRSAWRGRAIGQRLWERVLGLATALGCSAVQWQTPSWNDGAARFYRRLGASESAKLRYVLPLSGA
ncbi:GNAT family N-acetyltransferase [Dyella japonica]|uniref:GNAT superfamily N-acetyltransferase n=1 Tax=Dyella japonica TaxID=231455 RepID=A0ABV2JY86_9GAMM